MGCWSLDLLRVLRSVGLALILFPALGEVISCSSPAFVHHPSIVRTQIVRRWSTRPHDSGVEKQYLCCPLSTGSTALQARKENTPSDEYDDDDDENATVSSTKLKTLSPSELDSSDWMEKYDALVEFQNQGVDYGTEEFRPLLVPPRRLYPELERWTVLQRRLFRQGRLPSDRLQLLQKITPQWAESDSNSDLTWIQHYQKLKEIQLDETTFVVPSYKDHLKEWTWLQTQRKWLKQGRLLPHRKRLLDQLHPQWNNNGRQDEWDAMFQQFCQYQNDMKGSKDSSSSDQDLKLRRRDNPLLVQWLGRQRHLHRDGILPSHRLERLNQLNPHWASTIRQSPTNGMPLDERWESMYAELRDHQEESENKNANYLAPIPLHKNRLLFRWLKSQRRLYQEGKLRADRLQRLRELCSNWATEAPDSGTFDLKWEQQYQRLAQYISRNNATLPSLSQDRRVQSWIARQQHVYSQGKLSSHRTRKLDQLFPEWNNQQIRSREWMDKFEELKRHYEKHPRQDPSPNEEVSQWLTSQRDLYEANKLNGKRIRLLESLEGAVETKKDRWETMYQELVQFQESKRREKSEVEEETDDDGDARFYAPTRRENAKLAQWLRLQRCAHTRGALSQEQEALLRNVSPDWKTGTRHTSTRRKSWEARYEELVAHQKLQAKLQGDATVFHVVSQKENPQLFVWWANQQQAFRQGKLSPERLEKLQKLHRQWNTTRKGRVEGAWKETYEELRRYHAKRNGKERPYLLVDCEEDEDQDETASDLRDWLIRQRHRHRRGLLSEERVEAMNQLHANWTVSAYTSQIFEERWRHMFQQLVEFQDHDQNTAPEGWLWVPSRRANAPLWNWIRSQRESFRKGKLSEARRQTLQELNSNWTRFRTRKDLRQQEEDEDTMTAKGDTEAVEEKADTNADANADADADADADAEEHEEEEE